MIYFIQSGETGSVKIGFASTHRHVQRRLRLFQTSHPWKLHLLKTIPGDRDTEALLHRWFGGHRTHGEWFTSIPELLALIANPAPCLDHGADELSAVCGRMTGDWFHAPRAA